MANARTQGAGLGDRGPDGKRSFLAVLHFQVADPLQNGTRRLYPGGGVNSVTTLSLDYLMAFKGKIIGASLHGAAATTASTATLNVLKNGSAISGTGWTNPVLDTTNTGAKRERVLPANFDDFTFVEGDQIGAQVVLTSTWEPDGTDNDLAADVWLAIDDFDAGD